MCILSECTALGMMQPMIRLFEFGHAYLIDIRYLGILRAPSPLARLQQVLIALDGLQGIEQLGAPDRCLYKSQVKITQSTCSIKC